MKLNKKLVNRATRIAAFSVATGIAFLGAGNVFGMDALTSAGFGATGAILGLVGVLLFTYASKGDVPDTDFDKAINQAIEQVQSKTADKK